MARTLRPMPGSDFQQRGDVGELTHRDESDFAGARIDLAPHEIHPARSVQARRREPGGPFHLLHVLRGRRSAGVHRNAGPLAAGHVQQLGGEPRARHRVTRNRGDAEQFEIGTMQQGGERVGIVDVRADVGVEDDRRGKQWCTDGRTARTNPGVAQRDSACAASISAPRASTGSQSHPGLLRCPP